MVGAWQRELFAPSHAAGAGAEQCGEHHSGGSGDTSPRQSHSIGLTRHHGNT